MENFEALEKKINLKFKNLDLYKNAFIHRSYLNEHKNVKEHNERIEFLWDAVLELAVTDFLYKKFPKFNEWKLTNFRSSLVKKETLAQTARGLWLWDFLKLSKGENETWWRNKDYILANTFEAFLGAIYLDLWYKSAEKFVIENVVTKLDNIVEQQTFIDSKTKIQWYVQSVFKFTPKYETITESWFDHDKHYVIWIYSAWCLMWVWEWKSKQMAQQMAAKKACDLLWV